MSTRLDRHDPSERSNALFYVIVLAVLVRFVYFISYRQSPCHGFRFADSVYYCQWAQRIAAGDLLGQGPIEQGPLYAYLLAAAFAVGLPEDLVLVLQLLAGVATCVLVYACGRRLFSPPVALTAAVITALYGPLVYYECTLMKSFLSPLLIMLTLYAGLRYAESAKVRWVCLAGGAVGLACLLRESYVLLMIPLGLWVWQKRSAAGARVTGRLRHLVCLAGSFLLVLTPSAARNYLVAGEPALVTTGGGEVMYIAHGPYANGYWNPGPSHRATPWTEHQVLHEEAERRAGRPLTRGESSRFWYGEAFREIGGSPLRFLKLTGLRGVILFNDFEVPDSTHYKVWREFIPLLYALPTFGWLVGLGMIGIGICVRDWRRYELPLGIVAALMVSVLLTYNFGRFRIGMMPVWILFATAGLAWLVSALRKPGWGRGLALACLGGLAAITILAFQHPPNYPTYSRQRSGFRALVLQQAEARKNVVDLQRRLAREPDQPELHSLLARALTGVGRFDEARQHHQVAIQGGPSDATLRLHFADDLLATGHAAEAIACLQQVLEIDPALGGKVHYRLARAYRELEEVDRAISHLRLAAQADPGAAGPAYNLAVLLVTHPDADRRRRFAGEAASWAEKAYELRERRNPLDLHVLAAAYAELGRFDDAVAMAGQGMELARQMGNSDLVTLLEADRDRFRQGLTARLRPTAP